MPLSVAQTTIADDPSRFRVLVAGRRFGKTHLSIRELARFARYPNKKVAYIAPSYRQAKQTIWSELKERLIELRWVKKINESDLSIQLVNGSQIMLRSADNYDSMRGLGLDFVVFDEFADIAPQTWTEVVRPALSDRKGHGLFIGTPKGRNWAYDLYNQGQDAGFTDWSSYQYTTIEGGQVDDDEIEAARNDLDERTFQQEYEAQFVNYAGVIYYNFDRSLVFQQPDPEVQHNEVLHIGMDFNTNPMSAVVGVVRGGTMLIVDAIEIYSSSTQEMCDEIHNRYGTKRKIFAYPDASGGNANTKGMSDHNILRQNNMLVRSGKANPPVKDRIASVNSAFKNAKGQTRLWIQSSCKRLIESLEKHTYKGDTRAPDKDSGYDHLNDALGYLVHYHFPVKRPQIVDTTSVFGHF